MEDSIYPDLLRRNIIPILLGAAGLFFVLIGLIAVFSQSNKPDQLQFQAGRDATSSASVSSESKIIVDIEGAIIHPGIYTLVSSSRTHDLIVASGGLSASADREWFQKNLNQAAKLVDGQKIYIPRVGEDIMTGASSTSLAGDSASGLIGVNSASLTELDTLPGIGPVTAQKIVDNRPYSTLEDLQTKKAVTSSVFEKIKDKVSLN